MRRLPLADLAATLNALSGIFARSMGGSSGVLMAILFSSAGASAAGGSSLASAFMAGLERLQFYGGANVGDRTSVDALFPALKSLAAGLCRQAGTQGRGQYGEDENGACGALFLCLRP